MVKKIVLPIIVCLVLLVGCAPPSDVTALVQEAVNEESWVFGDSIVISEVCFTNVTVPQGAKITAARIVMVKR